MDDVENMPIEQVDTYLRELGYDPDQLGKYYQAVADITVKAVKLRAENERLRKALEKIAKHETGIDEKFGIDAWCLKCVQMIKIAAQALKK